MATVPINIHPILTIVQGNFNFMLILYHEWAKYVCLRCWKRDSQSICDIALCFSDIHFKDSCNIGISWGIYFGSYCLLEKHWYHSTDCLLSDEILGDNWWRVIKRNVDTVQHFASLFLHEQWVNSETIKLTRRGLSWEQQKILKKDQWIFPWGFYFFTAK